jgi:hypothetical protein
MTLRHPSVVDELIATGAHRSIAERIAAAAKAALAELSSPVALTIDTSSIGAALAMVARLKQEMGTLGSMQQMPGVGTSGGGAGDQTETI